MARPLRLEFAGAVWHVTARGNGRAAIFKDDGDREMFLRFLARAVGLSRWRLHSWVLMGNHYHLLLETPEPTLSRGIRDLNGMFTQAFNRRHKRSGHLFQGRYKAILVERESHLLELVRYVVLNPVRAGMVRSASDWKWSSHRAMAGLVAAPEWLETEWTLTQFGATPRRATRAYRAFVAEGRRSGYEPWKQVQGQIYLGGERFRGDMERLIRSRPAVRGVSRAQLTPVKRTRRQLITQIEREEGLGLAEMKAHPRLHIEGRRQAALRLRWEGMLSMREIGEILGVREWQASALVRAAERNGRAGLKHINGT